MRLLKDGAALDGGRSLAEQGIESNDTLAVIYQQEGAPRLATAAAILRPRISIPGMLLSANSSIERK